MIRTFCVNYCDDIRNEVGNKVSLMGLYGPDLLVPETPTILPKLCAFVQIGSEIGESFDSDIELRTTIDDKVVSSANLAVKQDTSVRDGEFQTARAQVVISPMNIEKPCMLRVRAYYKGQEYKSAALRIGVVSTGQAPPVEAT